jgi:8-amino-7-oxononanoate synthase
MNVFDRDLLTRLTTIREAELYRELRRIDSPQSACILHHGRKLLNFCSNDYLSLANAPQLKEAAIRAVDRYGAGAGASRLICGSLAAHHELDEALAQFKGTQAALSFSSGYAAAAGTICALLDRKDVVVLDKLVHACIIDAVRLSGAKMRVFAHNDLNQLEEILKWAQARMAAEIATRRPRTLVITESVFSMDGDQAPLKAIVEMKDRYGAWLMLDEAHATGLLGPTRKGLAEACSVNNRIEIQMGTLGKAIGSAGGYICGSKPLIEFLINKARTFIFSTAPVPAAAAAATAGIQVIQSETGERLCRSLWAGINQLTQGLALQARAESAIIPIHIGPEQRAVDAATALLERGIYVPAIRYPTVARGKARLRVTLTASHTTAQVNELMTALQSEAAAKSKHQT